MHGGEPSGESERWLEINQAGCASVPGGVVRERVRELFGCETLRLEKGLYQYESSIVLSGALAECTAASQAVSIATARHGRA